jgi:hypothetical protein
MMIMFEGKVAFNVEWVASKTLKAFCDHEKHHGLSKEQMKEIYDVCVGISKEKP